MELAIIAADVVQAHPWGAVRHTQRFVKEGGTVPELIEAVALAMIEDGVHSYKTCGREVIEAAEHIAGECEADGVMRVAAERPYHRQPQLNADREAGRD
jgi:hypothetical protein